MAKNVKKSISTWLTRNFDPQSLLTNMNKIVNGTGPLKGSDSVALREWMRSYDLKMQDFSKLGLLHFLGQLDSIQLLYQASEPKADFVRSLAELRETPLKLPIYTV